MPHLQLPGNCQELPSSGFTRWTSHGRLSGPERRWGGWKPQGRRSKLRKPGDNAFLTSLSDFLSFLSPQEDIIKDTGAVSLDTAVLVRCGP